MCNSTFIWSSEYFSVCQSLSSSASLNCLSWPLKGTLYWWVTFSLLHLSEPVLLAICWRFNTCSIFHLLSVVFSVFFFPPLQINFFAFVVFGYNKISLVFFFFSIVFPVLKTNGSRKSDAKFLSKKKEKKKIYIKYNNLNIGL